MPWRRKPDVLELAESVKKAFRLTQTPCGGPAAVFPLGSGQQVLPNRVHLALHARTLACDGNHRVPVRHDNGVLSKRAVAPECIMAASPELVTVTLVPIAFLFEFFEVGSRLLNFKRGCFLNPGGG